MVVTCSGMDTSSNLGDGTISTLDPRPSSLFISCSPRDTHSPIIDSIVKLFMCMIVGHGQKGNCVNNGGK